MVSGADITSSSLDWSQFKYMVFDVPNHGGTYQERYIELGRCPCAKRGHSDKTYLFCREICWRGRAGWEVYHSRSSSGVYRHSAFGEGVPGCYR